MDAIGLLRWEKSVGKRLRVCPSPPNAIFQLKDMS
jgi:hypothetical protein